MTTVSSREMPLRLEQLGEARSVDVVAHDWVVQLGVPVDLDGAWDMPGLVEQHILVGFDDDESGLTEAGFEPLAR